MEAEEIIAGLGSDRAKVRAETEAVLLQQGAETVPLLRELLAKETRGYRRRRRSGRQRTWALIGLVLLLIGLLQGEGMVLGAILIWFLFALSLSPHLTGVSRLHESLLHVLAKLDDGSSLGALIEMTDLLPVERWPELRSAQTCLLSRLTPEDAECLNEKQRSLLRRALNVSDLNLLNQGQTDHKVAILAALGKIEDRETVPLARALAYSSVGEGDRPDRIQNAAKAFLEVLGELREEESLEVPEQAESVEENREIYAFAQQQARILRRCSRFLYASLVATPLLGMVGFYFQSQFVHYDGEWTQVLSILSYVGMIGVVIAAAMVDRRGGKAVGALARQHNRNAVGPLIDLLDFAEPNLRLVAVRNLTLLLPRLQASDAGLLNARHMGLLCRVLRRKPTREDVEFQIVVLYALEQVGDASALPTVEQLAQQSVFTPSQRRVRDAAETCLPYLRARVEKEKIRTTLLRPADDPNIPAETLLRPAQHTPDADTALLLRPGSVEE